MREDPGRSSQRELGTQNSLLSVSFPLQYFSLFCLSYHGLSEDRHSVIWCLSSVPDGHGQTLLSVLSLRLTFSTLALSFSILAAHDRVCLSEVLRIKSLHTTVYGYSDQHCST